MKRRSSLDRLLDGLLRAPHDYRPSTNIFPDLDPGEVAEKFELEARGRQRNSGGEPPRDRGKLDDIEMQVIEHVKSAQRTAHQILQDELQSYAQRLGSLNFHERVTAIRQTAPDCIAEFHSERAKGENELHEVRRDLMEHEEERDDFREMHGLRRPARVHSSAASFLKWGFLILLLAAECALNGSFLAKGSQLGLVGGISEALAFAALNVGAALAAATLGARLILHRSYVLKFIGALAVAAWVCFTVLLNLALAHYREVAGTLATEGGRKVVARLQEAPFALDDIQSWVLFGIGVLFAGAAFVDSLLLFDPYWGYGSIEKRLRKSRKHYQHLHADLVDELHEIYSDYSRKLGLIGQDLAARLGEHGRIIEARKGRVDLFHGHQHQLESAANAILATYRNARGIAAGEPYSLVRINVTAANPDPKQREEIESLVKDAQSVLLIQTERLQAEFEGGIARYDQIDSLVGDKRESRAAA
jgi:hypothetical protein